MWAAWVLVTAACLAAVWTVTNLLTAAFLPFPSMTYPFWALILRMWVAPALGVAALALPLVALLTLLLFRRLYPFALAACCAVAVMLFAYAGLETYLINHETPREPSFGFVAEPVE